MRRAVPLAALLAALGSSAPAQSPAVTTPAPALTDAQKEHFLLEGEIVKHKYAGKGVTATERLTLRLGDREHYCHVTTMDEHRFKMQLSSGMEFDFRDSYSGYVAAYRLDRLLGINMVPVTVLRRYDQKPAAFTWWVDDVMFDEEQRVDKKIHPPDVEVWNRQMLVVRVFDQLIYNFDRNLTNLLIDKDWRLWMIDHGRAFKVFKELRSERQLEDRCDRRLLAALRKLDRAAVEAATREVLNQGQIEAVMARRDLIVKHYDAAIAKLGADKVLYDLTPPVTASAQAP
jgi:hypothetical protein